MSDTLTARPLGVDAVGDTHVRVDFGTNGDEMRPYARAALKTVPGATRYEYKGMFLEKTTGIFYGYFIVKGH